MDRKTLSDGMTVSAQLAAENFAELARQGVKLVINNRQDGEAPGQLSAAGAKSRPTRRGSPIGTSP
ncbi:MAG: beta-lactamase hydrolase domain-containing protein [Janthinobacterium lividum]